MLFQTFWAQTDLDPSNRILLIAKIYNFLNLNCADALNSNNCKQIKNIKIHIFLNLNCLDAPNSKSIETNGLYVPKFKKHPGKLSRCSQLKKIVNKPKFTNI